MILVNCLCRLFVPYLSRSRKKKLCSKFCVELIVAVCSDNVIDEMLFIVLLSSNDSNGSTNNSYDNVQQSDCLHLPNNLFATRNNLLLSFSFSLCFIFASEFHFRTNLFNQFFFVSNLFPISEFKKVKWTDFPRKERRKKKWKQIMEVNHGSPFVWRHLIWFISSFNWSDWQ